MLLSGSGDDPGKPPPPPPPTASTIDFTGAVDFDPQGGDGEHPDEVSLAIDGDPGTAWTTETYDAGLEGAPKTGVGLVLETAEPVTPSELDLQTDGGGWKFNVYGSNERVAPTEPPIDALGDETGAWGDPLAEDASADKSSTILLTATSPSRYFLIWITNLEGTPAAEISGAQLSS